MADSQYTSHEYASKNPGYHIGDSPWKARQISRMLRKHEIQPSKVVEVGCGAGEILCELTRLDGGRTCYVGYAISPVAHEICTGKVRDRVRFECADFVEASSEFSDVLLCIDVVEHVDDYLGFLQKLRSRAKWKIFHFPLDMSAQMVARGRPLISVREKAGHLHYFNRDTAIASLEYSGYEVVDQFYTFKPKSAKAKAMVLPRRILFSIAPDWTARILGGYSLLILAR